MGKIYLGNIEITNQSTGGTAGTAIDDINISEKTSYSSAKTEQRLTDTKNALIASQESMVNMWQKTSLNVKENTEISYITSENKVDRIIVQCYKFVPGETNVTKVIKEFNNGDEENFYHTDNVEFNGVAKIKDSYNINTHLNNDGLYESDEINTNEFMELYNIEVN